MGNPNKRNPKRLYTPETANMSGFGFGGSASGSRQTTNGNPVLVPLTNTSAHSSANPQVGMPAAGQTSAPGASASQLSGHVQTHTQSGSHAESSTSAQTSIFGGGRHEPNSTQQAGDLDVDRHFPDLQSSELQNNQSPRAATTNLLRGNENAHSQASNANTYNGLSSGALQNIAPRDTGNGVVREDFQRLFDYHEQLVRTNTLHQCTTPSHPCCRVPAAWADNSARASNQYPFPPSRSLSGTGQIGDDWPQRAYPLLPMNDIARSSSTGQLSNTTYGRGAIPPLASTSGAETVQATTLGQSEGSPAGQPLPFSEPSASRKRPRSVPVRSHGEAASISQFGRSDPIEPSQIRVRTASLSRRAPHMTPFTANDGMTYVIVQTVEAHPNSQEVQRPTALIMPLSSLPSHDANEYRISTHVFEAGNQTAVNVSHFVVRRLNENDSPLQHLDWTPQGRTATVTRVTSLTRLFKTLTRCGYPKRTILNEDTFRNHNQSAERPGRSCLLRNMEQSNGSRQILTLRTQVNLFHLRTCQNQGTRAAQNKACHLLQQMSWDVTMTLTDILNSYRRRKYRQLKWSIEREQPSKLDFAK